MNLFGDPRKRRLKRIGRIVDNSVRAPVTLDRLVHGDADKSRAESDLFDLVQADPELQRVMQRYQSTETDLHNALGCLLAIGCGQWVRGYYVAVSALAYPSSLDFVLRGTKGKQSVSGGVITKLIEYFSSERRFELR